MLLLLYSATKKYFLITNNDFITFRKPLFTAVEELLHLKAFTRFPVKHYIHSLLKSFYVECSFYNLYTSQPPFPTYILLSIPFLTYLSFQLFLPTLSHIYPIIYSLSHLPFLPTVPTCPFRLNLSSTLATFSTYLFPPPAPVYSFQLTFLASPFHATLSCLFCDAVNC
jgi:hypothetical protein